MVVQNVCLSITDTKLIVHFSGGKTGEDYYYLASSLEECNTESFDSRRAGTTNFGKYIVMPQGCLEIKTLTETEFVWKSTKQKFTMSARAIR